jgi:hypothetical protein
LANWPDFKNVLTDIEHLATELSTTGSKVTAIFTQKYHAEIAGEGVECGWGYSKKINRRIPLEQKRGKEDFIRGVKASPLAVTPRQIRCFRWRCCKYMLAYSSLANSDVTNLSTRSTK